MEYVHGTNEFEEKWSKLIDGFRLQNQKWMTNMFNLREMWLPISWVIESQIISCLRLVLSIPKSTTFFCNVLNALKASILSFMSFAEGTLPIKYLGVPLISSRLLYRDCKVLDEKLETREVVCLPYCEDGLGIRRLDDFNVALMTTYLGLAKASLNPDRIRPFIWHKINNGRSTSMWFDRWADSCPLPDMLTIRNIVCSGFSFSNTVSDLISNGTWRWPHDWSSRFPNVVNILVSEINNELDDVIVWHDVQGVFHRFSVAGAWDSLRLRADVVDWYHVIWFPHCIPRHALPMWLVIKEKLKTLDRLWQWDVWFQVHALTGMSSVPPRLMDVLEFLIPSKGSLEFQVRIVLFFPYPRFFPLGFSCKDEDKVAKFVQQLKTIKKEVKVQVPKPPSHKTGDVIEDIYAVEKPKQNHVNNPQGAINKGGRRGEYKKSRRQIALKAKTKQTEQPTRTDVAEEATNAS
uniref:Reverse transcriptase zinc-binding domain-containing protein n=1 Tax=Tanacetum cinerariifolium TaxID=118510 RepID=A0A699GJA2_TANCI|nr:hypothetical protein [Tanacetum cinerariifolium]